MSLGPQLARKVYDQAKRFGVAIVVTRDTPGAFDPVTGGPTPGVTLTQSTYAIVQPASGGTVQAFDIRFEAGTLIETNLRALMLSAHGLSFVPGPGDTVTGIEGSEWTVLGVTPQSVAGAPVTYNMTVRR